MIQKRLFFDVETIPCDEKARELYIAYRKKGLKEEFAEEKVEEILLDSALDSNYGRICCIAFVKEDGKLEKGIFTGEEKDIINNFWKVAVDAALFIGHNVYEFDLPFIYKRSIIHSVRPPRELSFARYKNFPIFDTMQEWDKWSYRNHTSLDTLAKIFGFPSSKDEMNALMVWPKYQEGKIEDIATYCMKDVELTRKIYYRMLLQIDPFESTPEHSNDLPF